MAGLFGKRKERIEKKGKKEKERKEEQVKHESKETNNAPLNDTHSNINDNEFLGSSEEKDSKKVEHSEMLENILEKNEETVNVRHEIENTHLNEKDVNDEANVVNNSEDISKSVENLDFDGNSIDVNYIGKDAIDMRIDKHNLEDETALHLNTDPENVMVENLENGMSTEQQNQEVIPLQIEGQVSSTQSAAKLTKKQKKQMKKEEKLRKKQMKIEQKKQKKLMKNQAKLEKKSLKKAAKLEKKNKKKQAKLDKKNKKLLKKELKKQKKQGVENLNAKNDSISAAENGYDNVSIHAGDDIGDNGIREELEDPHIKDGIHEVEKLENFEKDSSQIPDSPLNNSFYYFNNLLLNAEKDEILQKLNPNTHFTQETLLLLQKVVIRILTCSYIESFEHAVKIWSKCTCHNIAFSKPNSDIDYTGDINNIPKHDIPPEEEQAISNESRNDHDEMNDENIEFLEEIDQNLMRFEQYLKNWFLFPDAIEISMWNELVSLTDGRLEVSYLLKYLRSQEIVASTAIEIYHKIIAEHSSLQNYRRLFMEDDIIDAESIILSTSTISISEIQALFVISDRMLVEQFFSLLQTVEEMYTIQEISIQFMRKLKIMNRDYWGAKDAISRQQFHHDIQSQNLKCQNMTTVCNYIFNTIDNDFDDVILKDSIYLQAIDEFLEFRQEAEEKISFPFESGFEIRYTNAKECERVNHSQNSLYGTESSNSSSIQSKKVLPNVEDLIMLEEIPQNNLQKKQKPNPLYNSLLGACIVGNILVVKEQIQLGEDVNMKFDGRTPLLMASLYGHVDIVSLLIKNGAEVFPQGASSETPLMVAVQEGHVEVVKLLLDHSNPSLQVLASSMTLASMFGRDDIISLFLDRGISVDVKDEKNVIPLHIACEVGFVSTVRLLLEAHASSNIPNPEGLFPIHIAVSEGHEDVLRALLENNFDPNQLSEKGETPISIAIESGFANILEILLQNGADPDLPSNEVTPLVLAVCKESMEFIHLLYNAGVNINKAVGDGVTPLFMACERGNLEICRQLIEYNADINLRSESLGTPLFVASFHGYTKIVRTLLNEGANLEYRQVDGTTAILAAVEIGHIPTVRELVKMNANINVCKISDGNTPLHIAAEKGDLEMCEELLNGGANVNYENMNGDSPLLLSIINDHIEIVSQLLANGARCRKLITCGVEHFSANEEIQKLLNSNSTHELSQSNHSISTTHSEKESKSEISSHQIGSPSNHNSGHHDIENLSSGIQSNDLSYTTIRNEDDDDSFIESILLSLSSKNLQKEIKEINTNKVDTQITRVQNELVHSPISSSKQIDYKPIISHKESKEVDEDLIMQFLEAPAQN